MLGVIWPASCALLIPIVALEALLARRLLGITTLEAVLLALFANVASTLLGIPLVWALLTALEFALAKAGLPSGTDTWPERFFTATAYAPWLYPYESDFYWLAPAALIYLCVPFFFASVWIERAAAWTMQPDRAEAVRRWSWRANLTTYGLLVLALAAWLVVSVAAHSVAP